jgi:nucleoside-diphosphate-sugar epimerase
MDRALHVVFGSGQVGPLLARRLAVSGHRLRVVRRSEGPVPEGAEAFRGDATDPDFCAEAARGASVVYHCMNPAAYDRREWARLVPRFAENLVAAAGRSGARLVVLDNLYMLGRTSGRPMDEETPPNPCSAKGEVRARAAEVILAAHRRGDVRAVTGRASDFYGPGGVGTYFGPQFWQPAMAGKSVPMIVNPDTPHTYHYLADVAAGLAVLGSAADDALGRSWMLPCAPAETTRAMAGRLASALGRPIRLRRIPGLALRAMGLFSPILRELAEMAYQWDEPFVVDDRRFRARFGLGPTPLEEGARETVAWARRAFGAPEGGAAPTAPTR